MEQFIKELFPVPILCRPLWDQAAGFGGDVGQIGNRPAGCHDMISGAAEGIPGCVPRLLGAAAPGAGKYDSDRKNHNTRQGLNHGIPPIHSADGTPTRDEPRGTVPALPGKSSSTAANMHKEQRSAGSPVKKTGQAVRVHPDAPRLFPVDRVQEAGLSGLAEVKTGGFE